MILIAAALLVVPAFVLLLNYPAVSLGIFAVAYVLKGGVDAPVYLNLTAIALTITSAAVVTHVALSRRVRFRISPYDWCVVAIVAALLLGSIRSPDPDAAVVKTARFAVLVGLPYFLARIVLVSPSRMRAFAVTVAASAVLVAFPFIVASVFPSALPSFLQSLVTVEGRAQFVETNQVPLGSFFILGAIFTFALTAGKRGFSVWAGAAAVLMLLYAGFLTGTRGPFIAITLAWTLYLASVLARNPSRGTLAMIALSTGLLLIVSAGVHERLPNWGRFETMFGSGPDMSIDTRESLLAQALDTFLNEPLWGAGTAALKPYPHNIFAEVAAENGLIGLLPFVFILYLVAVRVLTYLFHARTLTPESRTMTYLVLLPLVTAFVGKQFSFELTSHKDLFILLAAAVNLPLLLPDKSPARAEVQEEPQQVPANFVLPITSAS